MLIATRRDLGQSCHATCLVEKSLPEYQETLAPKIVVVKLSMTFLQRTQEYGFCSGLHISLIKFPYFDKPYALTFVRQLPRNCQGHIKQ